MRWRVRAGGTWCSRPGSMCPARFGAGDSWRTSWRTSARRTRPGGPAGMRQLTPGPGDRGVGYFVTEPT